MQGALATAHVAAHAGHGISPVLITCSKIEKMWRIEKASEREGKKERVDEGEGQGGRKKRERGICLAAGC